MILLDELPPYFDNAMTRSVGAGTLAQVATAALSNLFSAALKLPQLCIVVSNLSGTYEGASKDLRRAIKNVEQEARRQAKPITPVELGGDEIYQILKKRLFEQLPGERDVEDVVQAYAAAIKEAEKAKAIAKSTEQIADEIRGSYPFHPSIKDLIALFRNNEGYRQTRGLMQFVSRAIHSVWQRPTNDVYLIGLQHLDLNDSDVRDEVLRINDLRGAIATDIASAGGAHAETIDSQTGNDAAAQAATLLLSASLSTAVDGVKGLTKQRLLERLIAPNRSVLEFAEAFDHLRREAWYLHRDESDAHYFSNVENLTKRLSTEAERAPANKIDTEMRRRLESIFQPKRRNAYQELKALPMLDEVRLDAARVLLVLSPDTKHPPEAAAEFLRVGRPEEQPLHPHGRWVRPRKPRGEDPHALRGRQAAGDAAEEPSRSRKSSRSATRQPSRTSTPRSPPRSTASGTRASKGSCSPSSRCSSRPTTSTARNKSRRRSFTPV